MVKIGMLISDRYEIIEKVGSGGMADVYKARCHRLNRFVAIKILKQEYSTDTKFVTKFRAEAQSVAGLSHPNVVGIYDVGEDDGLHYIVMELIEGITLKNYIERKGKLSVKEAVGIAIQIAQGLEAAHNHSIIHRDIKPQNIIISKEGKAKVTDFGIAKAASSNTITSNAMGSVHYISPEQARGGYSDEKSDIYSLGVTLYEMLSGIVPFTGESTVAVALSHIQDDAVLLTTLDDSIPKSLEKIVQKCMQKKPELRYLSAMSLITDLKQSLADPEGNFVKILPLGDDSPTIYITDDEVSDIRNASKVKMQDTLDLSDEKMDVLEKELKEEEPETDIDPKLERALVIGTIAVAAILGIVVIAIIGKMFIFNGGNAVNSPTPAVSSTAPSGAPTATSGADQETVTMEDLTNLKEDEAKLKLTNLGINQYNITKQTSDTIKEGYVISTSPAAGEDATKDTVVEVVVSSGSEKIVIPDVSKLSVTEAETQLKAAGFTVERASEYSDTIDVNLVTRTSPAAGQKAAKGDKVAVYVSKGKEITYATVPDLSGSTKTQAIAKLKKVKLKAGTINNDYSDTVASGKVMAQSIVAGSEVETGTTIDFTISLGSQSNYQGSVNINNPFAAGESGTIVFMLEQDGQDPTPVKEIKNMTASDFPRLLQITSKSGSPGIIKLYKDGVQIGEAYPITFMKATQ